MSTPAESYQFKTIQFYPGPRVAAIVLNRAPLNIINIEMMDELQTAWDEIEGLEARIVVISAAGDQAFSAGVEISEHVSDKVEAMLERFRSVINRIYQSNCITIAAVHGHTLGGGAELAMICDLVVGADDTKLGQPEINLGCYPPAAAAYLPRAVGFHRASEMLLLGEPIPAEEALRIGLLNRVVPKAQLSEAVDDYVTKLLSKSSSVLALAKQALREGMDHRFKKAFTRAEKLYLKKLVQTEDMKEGLQAFLEKRPPAWKNR